MIFLMVIGIVACYIGAYFWLSRRQFADKAVLFMIAPTVDTEAIPDGFRDFHSIIKKSYPKAACYVALSKGCSAEQRKVAEKTQKRYRYETYKNQPNNKIFQKIYLFIDLRQGF